MRTCNTTNKTGGHCSRPVGKVRKPIASSLCWQHNRLKHEKVDPKDSHIKKSGKGLYVFKNVKKNQIIASYTGKILTPKETKKSKSDYVLETDTKVVVKGRARQFNVDGKPSTGKASFGSFANDCRPSNKHKKECKGNNAKFVEMDNPWKTNAHGRVLLRSNGKPSLKPNALTIRAKKNIKASYKKPVEVFVNYGNNFDPTTSSSSSSKKSVTKKKTKKKACSRC